MNAKIEVNNSCKKCTRDEDVPIVDEHQIRLGGGRPVNTLIQRTIKCSHAPDPDGSHFQLTMRQEWMCDDCNLVR
jgi:hypothetical protein